MTQSTILADDATIRQEILRQTALRGSERSICPSEVARALAGGDDGPWRPLMAPVRRAAVALAQDGRVEILRKGKPVPPEAMRGVVRLRAVVAPAAEAEAEAEAANG